MVFDLLLIRVWNAWQRVRAWWRSSSEIDERLERARAQLEAAARAGDRRAGDR